MSVLDRFIRGVGVNVFDGRLDGLVDVLVGGDDGVARCEGGRNCAGTGILGWRFGGGSEAGVYIFVIVS